MSQLFNARRRIAEQVFAGWSSGNPDAPEQFFTPDAVLMDVASGRFEGWPAIRQYFAGALTRTGNLTLVPDEFWENDDGIAVHYVMSGDVGLATTFGPEHVGRRWHVEVMSLLRFDGDRVKFEGDFHDRGARQRSLGL